MVGRRSLKQSGPSREIEDETHGASKNTGPEPTIHPFISTLSAFAPSSPITQHIQQHTPPQADLTYSHLFVCICHCNCHTIPSHCRRTWHLITITSHRRPLIITLLLPSLASTPTRAPTIPSTRPSLQSHSRRQHHTPRATSGFNEAIGNEPRTLERDRLGTEQSGDTEELPGPTILSSAALPALPARRGPRRLHASRATSAAATTTTHPTCNICPDSPQSLGDLSAGPTTPHS